MRPTRDACVNQMREILPYLNASTCVAWLEATGFDVERAINGALASGGAPPQPTKEEPSAAECDVAITEILAYAAECGLAITELQYCSSRPGMRGSVGWAMDVFRMSDWSVRVARAKIDACLRERSV